MDDREDRQCGGTGGVGVRMGGGGWRIRRGEQGEELRKRPPRQDRRWSVLATSSRHSCLRCPLLQDEPVSEKRILAAAGQ
jgi:hypothetical protein